MGATQTWLALAPAAVEAAVVFLVLCLVLENRGRLMGHWKAAIAVGCVIYVLEIPSVLRMAAGFDPAKLQVDPSAPMDPATALAVASAVALLLYAVKIGYHAIAYRLALAEWGQVRPDAVPLERGLCSGRWSFLGGAFVFGLAAGVVSAIVLKAFGLVPRAAPAVVAAGAAGAASLGILRANAGLLVGLLGAAIAEEVAFRGLLLGWMLRRFGKTGWRAAFCVVAVSALWGLQHVGAVNLPWVKFGQIFVLGLFFGEIARRRCVEGAVAAHLGLNVAAPLMGLFFG